MRLPRDCDLGRLSGYRGPACLNGIRRAWWCLAIMAGSIATPWDMRAEDAVSSADRPVAGRMVDADGRPADGATVWVVPLGSDASKHRSVQTDARGAFQLSIPGDWLQPRPYQPVAALIAHHADHGIAALAFISADAIPKQDLELQLRRSSGATFAIDAPDGEPVAGASVFPSTLGCETLHVGVTLREAQRNGQQMEPRETPWGVIWGRRPFLLPEELQQRLAANTDSDGQVTITVPPEWISTLTVKTPDIGKQSFTRVVSVPLDGDQPSTIRLLAPVPITGQLVGDPEVVAGKTIQLAGSVQQAAPGEAFLCYTQHNVTTDAEGRFDLTGFEATWWATVAWDQQSPLRPVATTITAKLGQENRLEILLKPAVRVFGYVRDTDGNPAAGVQLNLWDSDNRPVVTDAEGRYEVRVAPGQLTFVSMVSDKYFPKDIVWRGESQLVDGRKMQLEPIIVRRAAVAEGVVVDGEDQPVAGAEVRATWYGYSPRHFRPMLQQETVQTDQKGRFAIKGIDPAATCLVAARHDEAATRTATVFKANEPLRLTVSADQGVRLRGRVVDGAGEPVSAAPLELWYRPHRPQGVDASLVQVEPSDSQPFQTDATGEFVTPVLWPDGEYRVRLVSEEFQRAATAWMDVTTGPPRRPEDLIARRLGEHLGVVTDRSGAPVSGARVVYQGGGSRRETQTDEEGRFQFDEAPDGPGFLFVDADGFRFHGQKRKTWGPLTVELARVDQPYGQSLELEQPRWSEEQRVELALKLRDELLASIDEDEGDAIQSRARVLAAVAKSDPQAALSALADDQSLSGQFADMVRFEATKALLETSPEKAAEVVDQMTFAHMRSMLYGRIAAALPDDQRDRKLELLAEGYARAEAIGEPGFRLIAIASVAERLLDMGQAEQGRSLLLDNHQTAQSLNKSGYDAYLRGAFAEELVQVDIASAVALVDEIDDWFERNRHLGNMAHELAATQPAEAERLLAKITPPPEGSNHFPLQDGYAVRVCYRMAKVDLERARRIAQQITDPLYKAQAYGVMAAAIAQELPQPASELVREAFGILEDDQRTSDPEQIRPIQPGAVGGMLLVHAQRIDPELGAEMLWRLMSLLPELSAEYGRATYGDVESLAAAAMFVSLFEPALAEEILLRTQGHQSVASSRAYLPAWGLIDPEFALEKATGAQEARQRFSSKLSLIEALTATGERRLRLIHGHASLWFIDDEDFGN